MVSSAVQKEPGSKERNRYLQFKAWALSYFSLLGLFLLHIICRSKVPVFS